MHIERVPNRNSPPAVLLRQSYREDGKVRKRTLANLSKLPDDAIEGLRILLKDIRAGLIAVTKAAIARCLDAFAPLRFGGGDWGYCRGGERPCQQPPLYNFSIGPF